MMVANSMIRSLHAARSRAGMDEELFRDWLEQNYGTRHVSELGADAPAALRVLNGKADDAPKRAGRKPLEGPYTKKLQALWLSAWNLGIVKNRADEAMLAFVERQTGIQRTEFLRADTDATKVVEALKHWIAREGGVDWSAFPNPQDAVVEAQCIKLGLDWRDIEISGNTWSIDSVSATGRVGLMQALGQRIRRAKE